jgi:inosine-uridine nucleoside N-ribohydrolase
MQSVAETPTAVAPSDTRRKIIIDTDTATDDALAILLALFAPNIKIEAITITVGNVDFEQVVQNHCCDKPMLQQHIYTVVMV